MHKFSVMYFAFNKFISCHIRVIRKKSHKFASLYLVTNKFIYGK